MKIGGTSSKPSFGAIKPKAKSKPIATPAAKKVKKVVEPDDVLEVELEPAVPSKIASRVKKLSKFRRSALETAAKLAGEDEDDIYDSEEIDRSKALALAPTLGIPSFEVGADIEEETLVEDPDEEGMDEKQAYENARKNTRKIEQPSTLPGAKTNRVRAIRTMFGQRADAILGLLEDDHSTDGALTLIQRTLLQTLVDVLPVVERSVRRSHGKHGVIPLNQMISQMRELVSDIQSLRDRGELGATVVERILRPSFLDIGVQIVVGFSNIEMAAKARMTEADFGTFMLTLNETKKGLAGYMQGQYAEVKEGVAASLS